MPNQYAEIALDTPLRQTFDYLIPQDVTLAKGARVVVTFGSRSMVAYVLSVKEHSEINPQKIKPLDRLIDDAFIPEELIDFCHWVADYYLHPIGEVLTAAIPPFFRNDNRIPPELFWVHTTEGKGLPFDALKRSPKQQALHQLLLTHEACSNDNLKQAGISTTIAKAMMGKGLITQNAQKPQTTNSSGKILKQAPLEFNAEQSAAYSKIRYHHFGCYLLHGETGSGKTELYLQLTEKVLRQGKQVLILVPEIGLTPQTVRRFQARFEDDVVELNSTVAELQRAKNWMAIRNNAKIIIGTRLAAFAPLKDLGLIIVDEEHDNSYKQQEGLRYSARDCAIYRAKLNAVPIILGSATPSLESLHNAQLRRYRYLRLENRAGQALKPSIQKIDLRHEQTDSGLANTSLLAIKETLSRGEQALIFLNRKGYASAIVCEECGWYSLCRHCSSSMVLHTRPLKLICHHCGHKQLPPQKCPNCGNTSLSTRGMGTEKLELELAKHFPTTDIVRFDRSSTQSKSAMRDALTTVQSERACIIIGTQMLAKGHHFPKLSLVVIVDGDQGLTSPSYKAMEQLGQLFTQVSGRAGREKNLPGKVLLQTYMPEHPSINTLITEGYKSFAKMELDKRQTAELPPFWFNAMFRAESKRAENAYNLLEIVANNFDQMVNHPTALRRLGPLPAPIEKIQDRYRFQLEIKAHDRLDLRRTVAILRNQIEQTALSKRVRWSIDINPID